MIIGIFVRHYKCYRKLNYVPFITPYNQPKFNVIIGANGSGKSSIIEALNVYFNKDRFILSDGEKWQEALISPVFLIEKSSIDRIWRFVSGSIKKKEIEDIAHHISDYLWTFSASSSSMPQMEFQDSIESLGSLYSSETHWLLVDGVDFNGDLTLARFEDLRETLEVLYTTQQLKQFFSALKSSHCFIYIPVETSISDYLKLENQGIQNLIGLDIKQKIDSVLETSIKKDEEAFSSLISFINSTLKIFVDEIEESIRGSESDYSFKPDYNVKQSVTARDLRDRIIEEFFKNRQLKLKNIKIQDLSSGQRKKALIDIIYALIHNYVDIHSDREIIIAIDEPEASLHVNNCFEQFEKLQRIADCGIQTFVTTHWYGALPILTSGTILHVQEFIGEPPTIRGFNSSNLYDNHDVDRISDINFKSIYDLASSILSSLRNSSKNWLVVEGNSDKIFLESYFKSEDVKILSIGGIDKLIALVDFLSIPLKKREEQNQTKGKIIFLSDNDLEYKLSDFEESKSLMFKRYTFVNGSVKLVNYSDTKHGQVLNIEDVMNSKTMWTALEALSIEIPELELALHGFELENDFQTSMFSGDYSFLKTNYTGVEKIEAQKKLFEILKPLKTRLAICYRDIQNKEEVEWINELRKLLKK